METSGRLRFYASSGKGLRTQARTVVSESLRRETWDRREFVDVGPFGRESLGVSARVSSSGYERVGFGGEN